MLNLSTPKFNFKFLGTLTRRNVLIPVTVLNFVSNLNSLSTNNLGKGGSMHAESKRTPLKNTTHHGHGTTAALRADMNTLHGLTMAAGNETTGSTTLFVISTKDDGRHFFYTR